MTDKTGRPRPALYVAVAAVAGLAAGVAGVYVSGGADVHGDTACAGTARDLAAVLKPLAHGEVAALLPADEPRPMADLAFRTVDGAPVSLADFSGKVLLVNLWATWCAPCRAEMPALDRLQAARGGDDFEVVTVNIDVGDPAKPAAFLEEIGIAALTDWRDPKMATFNRLKGEGLAFGLPTTLLVDRKGCQVAALHGPAEWDSADALAVVDAAIAAP